MLRVPDSVMELPMMMLVRVPLLLVRAVPVRVPFWIVPDSVPRPFAPKSPPGAMSREPLARSSVPVRLKTPAAVVLMVPSPPGATFPRLKIPADTLRVPALVKLP